MLNTKRILITGAAGFIGSHLAESLVDRAGQLRVFLHYNALNHRGCLNQLPRNKHQAIEVVWGDLRDYQTVRSALTNIDYVFHLAALIAIPYSYQAPESYIETNIKGTLNVLQAAQNLGTERILITSTSEVYGTAQYIPIDEHHPFQGQSPYSASKIGADRLAESFYRSYELPITLVRPFNTYGPRQSARAVIPTIITQVLSGQKTIHLGSLSPTRDFVYVKDTVEGFIQIAAHQETIGEEINIATQKETSIQSLVEEICRLVGRRVKVLSEEARIRPSKSEVDRLLGSNEKIRRLTGWRPRFSLTRGLAATIKWCSEKENFRRIYQRTYAK
jgi:NAD dependent epimerase/dehydratase